MKVLTPLLASVGFAILLVGAAAGYKSSITEVGGLALADHAMDFCPNFVLGFAEGLLTTGLAWWAWPRRNS